MTTDNDLFILSINPDAISPAMHEIRKMIHEGLAKREPGPNGPQWYVSSLDVGPKLARLLAENETWSREHLPFLFDGSMDCDKEGE